MNPRDRRKAILRAVVLLETIARKHNVDARTIRAKGPGSRYPAYTKAREDFVCTGRIQGLGVVEMGVALNRDRTTVSYHANPAQKAHKKRRMIATSNTADFKWRRKLRHAGVPYPTKGDHHVDC